MIPELLQRYFSQRRYKQLLPNEYRIATSRFVNREGQTYRNVVLTLNNNAHLLRIVPLHHETADTIWHRGTLLEHPSGEIVIISPSHL